MIDLSFLTEAEQEAILKVLHRDAELKKAEEKRVRQLQDAVDDDNELKNKSGQWFYDAKSKRHRDTIHGADLVRASIRKRNKPSTIAELSEKQMDKKKSWVNSVKNVFIPPELYGVMEEPEEGLEDLQQTKEQINHSAKRVSFLSADNDKENLMNGAASPAKIRKNPFNAELDGIDTDFGKVQLPENGTDPPNTEPEPLYAVVKRIPKQDLPEDFDMEDIHMKPRVFGQEWKKPNVVSSGKPLEFGKSYGGGGKISYGTSYLNPQPQSNKVFSTERPAYTESYESGDKSWSETEDEPSYIDSVHSVIVHQRNVDLNTNRTENQPYVNNKKEFGSLTSKEETKEPKFQSITFDANPDDLRFPDNQNKRNLEYFPREPKNQSKYKPVSINNVDGIGENVPANLSSQNLARNDIVSDTRESLNLIFLNQLREKNDLPQSANFKVMSLKDRINDSTNEQISNPSQFQSLRSYWNVEEKNKDTEVSPNSILSGVLNRSKPVNSDPPQINFAEVTVDPEVPTNTVLNDFISRKKPLRPALQSGSSAVVSPKVTEVSNTVFTDSARTRPIKSDSQQIYPTEITKDPSKNIEVLSKFLPRFQNKPAPITSEIPQREITDPLLLPDTYDSISEEDQTSQKVASWLAQSPNHYEEEQMYPSEEPAYPREDVVENIKKSVAPQKSNVEEFSSALEKLREEAFLTPNTEMEHLGTTEESKGFPTQDAEMHHHDLETLSEEDQASQKVSSWLERTPPNYDEEMYPSEEHLYPQEEIVENVQKTLAPQRSDKDEFSSALAKLQEEASFSTDEMVDHTEDINTFPKEEVGVNNMKTSETALPVKNLGKESYGNKARSGDIRFFEKVKQISKSSENEAANTFIPRNTIDSDRVERHHPVKEAVQDFQPMNSGGTKINSNYAQEEVVVQKTLAPVNNANDAFKNALERLVKEHETLDTVDNSEYENSIEEEQSHVYEAMGVHKEEIIERTTLPTKQDLQEFTAALNRLEIEASETSHIPETSSSDHFEEPRSNLISSRESPVLEDTYHRRENIPYRSNEDQSDFSIQFSRATSTSEEEIETLNKDLYMTLKMLPDIKYSEAYPVHEETSIAESINTDELQRRLMQIHEDEDLNEHLKEEDVKPPNWDSEEPNDLVKDKVKVSEIPYKETLVSKKVYSDIESKPSLQDESEPEPHDLTYPIARRPQDLYLASRSKSPLKNAGYGETGSYSRRPGNLSYKQPEIEPPEVSKPSSVETKQGLEDPVLKALKRTAAKTVPKDVQDIPPTDPNKEKLDIPNRDLGDLEVPSENLLVESQFSNPEKLKRLSQSVPVLLQDETDGRETDSASESSFQIGRHKKSPSSLTNLSGSSGMASLSSVSGSVMSVYSGDFGNIDIKGNIQFAVDYVEQLQEFHVFVSQCKDLAVADLKKQRSDPYVKSYLLPDKAKMGKRKTVVKKKSQNPSYNEVLRYKISKEALLTQTLNLSVWHNDALGRNSFLGEVDLGLATWDWNNKQMNWYPLQPRTPAAGIGLENRGDMKLALKYVPEALPGTNVPGTGEVHIQLKECKQLPMLRGNKINSFIKCTILPDTSRKSRQKTRAVDKTPNPIFNHTMVYDGFKTEDLKEACVELTVWDRNRLTNHFLGGLRIGLGTGKSYGTAVDWMDSSIEESTMWERMMNTPNTWIEGVLPLRMLRMAKLAK